MIVGKLIVDFLYIIIEHFSLALTTEALIDQNPPLLRVWVTLVLNIRLKSYIYCQHLYTVG